MFAIGMKQDAVNTIGMAGQRAHRLAVGSGPEFDKVIITARGNNLAIGRDRQTSRPTVVSSNHALRLGLVLLGTPPDYSSIARGREDSSTLVRKSNGKNPTLVTGVRGLDVARQVPALERSILGTGKDAFPDRIESAGDQRRTVSERLGDVG